MANVKTSAETAAAPLSGAELVRLVQDSSNVQATVSQLVAFAAAGIVVVPVTYAATTTVNLSAYSSFTVVILDLTLTGNVTFNLTNGTNGQAVKLRVRQDSTGSRIWTSGANLRFGSDITSIVLSTGVSKLDYVGFEWNGTNSKADVLAIVKGL